LSDQTEKPKGALPKGYEPNAQGEPQDQDKKIWDKYYNGEIELPDVVKKLKHFRSSKDAEPETSDEDHDAVLKAWKRTQNIYGYSRQKAKPKQGTEKELKEYEKKYLARYKQPKAKPKKLSNLKYDIDIGRLNLRKHAVTKRREYLTERKEYEKKYLARYKQPKASIKKSSNLKYVDLGRLNLRKHAISKRREYLAERKEYEKEYLARYNKQQKAKPKKKAASSNLYKPEKPKPKRDMKKERKEYEKKYLARYKQPKVKPKKKK